MKILPSVRRPLTRFTQSQSTSTPHSSMLIRFLTLFAAAAVMASTAPAATESPDLPAAVALFNAGQSAEAQVALVRLAAITPDNPDVNFYLGQLAFQRSDYPQAIACLEKAVAVAPADARFQNALGWAYSESAHNSKDNVFRKFSQGRKGLAAFERAVALEPRNTDYRLSLLGYYQDAPFIVGGSMSKAYAQAEAIQQLDPLRGTRALGMLAVSDKNYSQAATAFADVLRLAPTDYLALYQTGKLAVLTGQQLDQGLAALTKCLGLAVPADAPPHAAAQWRIGQILETKNALADARRAYEAALQLDPKLEGALQSLKNLPAEPHR